MAGNIFLMTTALLALGLAGCTSADEDTEGAAGAGDAVLDQLRALYVDHPLDGGQETPSHTFLENGDGTFSFLHWNNADPAQATGLMFVGDAFFANGCRGEGGISQDQIDAGYVHFHKGTAANWDQGHHADANNPDLDGFWFRHIAAAPGVDPMEVGASDVGSVYPLMPSYENAPLCV